MNKKYSKLTRRIRHKRVRRKVVGTVSRPRLCVFRSLNHIYAQIIDDSEKHTLIAMSTLNPQLRNELNGMSKTKQAELVGTMLAEKAMSKEIKRVVFDRGGNKYHGRINALANAARKAGLEV